MDVISAVRELCKGENGFVNMFDKAKSGGKLASLTGGDRDAELFESLLYGKARSALVEMINDAYNYKDHAIKVQGLLASDGLSESDSKRALEIFFRAFGFPGYREMDKNKVSNISSTIGESFHVEYEGEVRNGKEHGVGVRTCYYEGKWCNYDECVWVDGVMYGYDNAKEMEFGMFEDKKIGFVVNDYFVGNTKIIPAGDNEEFYDTGKKFEID